MKEIIGAIAILLVFISYIPYFRDIFKGKTKPHVYSWFVWALLTILIAAVQLSEGGGPVAYVTMSAGTLTFLVFLLSLKNGKKDITTSDTVFFITALLATGLWLFADQPLTSMTLAVGIGVLGMFPTLRKSWNKPNEETLFLWSVNGIRHFLSIGAIVDYNPVTLMSPVAWTAINLGFSILLVLRRKQLILSD